MVPGTDKPTNTWLKLLKPSGHMAQALIWLLGGALIYASNVGYLDHFREVLSNGYYAFSIGDYELNVYMILKGIFIVAMMFWVTAIISSFGEKRIGSAKKLKDSTKQLITKLFQIFVYFVAFLVSLDLMGIQLTALAVFGGALGIGLGFGLQKITSNFISGMILLFERTIEQGDLIDLQNGFSGFVRRISARFTLLETFDGKEIMIPNEDFITSQVINWTYSSKRGRVEIDIGVSYNADLERVREVLLECASAHPRCIPDPAPSCFLMGFGDNSVNFKMYFWIDDVTEGRYGPKSDVLFAIWRAFKAESIEIPFPQRDLHLRVAEGLELLKARPAKASAKADESKD